MDQRGERGGLIAPAWIAKKVAGKRRTPVLQHLNEVPFCERLQERVFEGRTDAQTVAHCLDDQIGIIEGCRSLRTDGDCPAAFPEFPSVKVTRKAKPDAGMLFSDPEGFAGRCGR